MGIDARMLIRYRGEKPTEDQLTRWSWDLCRSIGAEHFYLSDGDGDAIVRAVDLTKYEDDEPGRAYYQDGPTLYANTGEWLLEVSLITRYYGIGYERGDILTICAIAEWIEQNMQPCKVLYGGDSSGVTAVPFHDEVRRQYRAHLYSQSGRDYFKAFDDDRKSYPIPEQCGLCVRGENRLIRYGWGNNYVALRCAGCGKNFETRDNGVTWEVSK